MGRLTADPKTAEKVTKFNLAVDRRYKAEGEEKPKTDFFQVSAFGKTKELADKYLKKGMKIQVTGTIQNDNYEKDGATVYQNSFITNEIEFCEKKETADIPTEGVSEEPVADGNELPFN